MGQQPVRTHYVEDHESLRRAEAAEAERSRVQHEYLQLQAEKVRMETQQRMAKEKYIMNQKE